MNRIGFLSIAGMLWLVGIAENLSEGEGNVVANASSANRTVFPASSAWNTRIDDKAVDPNSAAYIAAIGAETPLHPDFGTGHNGIPCQFVDLATTRVSVSFDYADESDKGPYPIPAHPLIEGEPGATSGDRHLLLIDRDNWVLYELWQAVLQPDGSWHAGSGAIWDLKTDSSRPKGWTSADAAGLPIFPGWSVTMRCMRSG